MDVDGDGTEEALALMKSVPQESSFTLEILDLKPLHGFRKTYLEPFRPKVIFASEEIHENNAHPIHLTTGQLLIEKRKLASSNEKSEPIQIPEGHEINDQTRKYFCGHDWHDASSKCKVPCPGGQASECPNDERCFADTPCDLLSAQEKDTKTKSDFELTPGGGLPSVVSLWDNGVVILHSLTNFDEKAPQRKDLDLQEMWRYRIFPSDKDVHDVLWEEINVVFLDAYSSMDAVKNGMGEHGMVIVSASYYLDGNPESARSTFTVAIDALQGKIMWESHSDAGEGTDDKPLPLPMAQRGQTSFARRRSSVARVMQGTSKASASALPNCMSLLRKAVKKEVFPYSYWGPKDAGVAAIHLNQKGKSGDNRNHRASKPHEEHGVSPKAKKWHRKLSPRRKKHNPNEDLPIQGKPNALVTQSRGGLQIRSLKNGKALCHLALLEENLYSDLNNDGVLDQIQVALHTNTLKPNDKFVWKLAGKLHEEQVDLKKQGVNHEDIPQMCHLLGLSGIPAREEMFSTPICGKVHERPKSDLVKSLDSVNPLVVESLGRRGDKHDIVVALNNGMIHRIHGSAGRRQWALSGTQHTSSFPTWEEESSHNALLARIQANEVAPLLRPLLLTGDNSLAVMSVKTGSLLATAKFPQKSESRPILADLSGDGATDVLIFTKDGIWGYRIVIHRSFAVTQRILVGLLMMVLMLATIRNRYSKGGKRSTDA